LKMKKNWSATTFLTILLVSLATPMLALPTSALDDQEEEPEDLKLVSIDHWFKLETDIVTVLFPREGQKPMFIWWYTKAPDMIYAVKYQGLIEYFAFEHTLIGFEKPEYYNHLREAWHERFEEMYMKPEEERCVAMGQMGMTKLTILQQIMMQIEAQWHRPFFPFDAARWNLSEIKNITNPEGKKIGVAFAFTLVEVPEWMPGFQFAENNIMIRVRFYNETVEETVPGTGNKYTVNAGEMKMDFVVSKWVWNIDAIKDLITYLKEHDITVTLPEGKTRLALWVNLASINITKLALAEDEPEGIEEHSTASHMEIEDTHEDIRENMTVTDEEKPIVAERPWWVPWQPREKPVISLRFATEDKTLLGFFRFVSSAKVTNPKNVTNKVPVRAAYIAAGRHLRLFLGYPYFSNGTLEHDPSIGVDVAGLDTSPKYTIQAPSGSDVTPIVLGKYVLPLFTTELTVALIAVVSATAIILYVTKWKRKTPVNMVGAGTTG